MDAAMLRRHAALHSGHAAVLPDSQAPKSDHGGSTFHGGIVNHIH